MLCPRSALLNPGAAPAVLSQPHRQYPPRSGSCIGPDFVVMFSRPRNFCRGVCGIAPQSGSVRYSGVPDQVRRYIAPCTTDWTTLGQSAAMHVPSA